MIGKLLLHGMLAGVAAGLLAFGFAKIAGEPPLTQAIALEEKAQEDKGEAPGAELVSRKMQAGLGLFTGVVIYGAALGGLFALVFAYAYGRVGKLSARALSAWLAMAAFIALTIVPALKYPANPPSVGVPETIGYRTSLFFFMIVVSLAAMALSLNLRRQFVARFGPWNASMTSGAVFIAIIAAAQLLLPSINEVPDDFPAALLWNFRVAAIGMQLILWTTIGLLFGWLVERYPPNIAAKDH